MVQGGQQGVVYGLGEEDALQVASSSSSHFLVSSEALGHLHRMLLVPAAQVTLSYSRVQNPSWSLEQPGWDSLILPDFSENLLASMAPNPHF